jgi:arylsulfatase A-like enzyme
MLIRKKGKKKSGMALLAAALTGAAVTAGLSPGASCTMETASKKESEVVGDGPNILWLMMDHVQFHHYVMTRDGKIGGEKPILDAYERVACEGIEFSRAYSVEPICVPARASMVTGMYPIRTGTVTNLAQDNNPNLIKNYPTYNHYLQPHGYGTGFFGKNHTHNGSIESMGFDGWSSDGYGQPYLSEEYRSFVNGNGAEYFQEWGYNGGAQNKTFIMTEVGNWNGPNDPPGYRSTSAGYFTNPSGEDVHEADLLAKMTKDYIDKCIREQKKFCVQLNTWGPHQPYQVPAEAKGCINPAGIEEYPSFRDQSLQRPEFVQAYLKSQNTGLSTWTQWQPVVARAYESYTYIDMVFGKLLDYLDEKGLAQNTLVIITADHGDELASHGGLTDKGGNLSEEVMHIPLVMRWPGKIAPGTKSDAFVSNVDITPTVIAAAAGEPPAGMDGKNLLPLMLNGDDSQFREYLGFHFGHQGIVHTQRAFYSGDYKYIATAGDTHELYNLANDPFELHNLINDPASAQIVADMGKAMLAYMDRIGDFDMKETAKLREALESGNTSGKIKGPDPLPGDEIWMDNFDDMTVGASNADAITSRGIGFSPAGPDSAAFSVQQADGNRYPRIHKPVNTPGGQASVFTLSKPFDIPFTGKYGFEMKIMMENIPPQADFEGKGSMAAERWIFLDEMAVTDNTNPRDRGIGICFRDGKIICGSAQVKYSVMTWYMVQIITDSGTGRYDILLDGTPLVQDAAMPMGGIRRFGLYAHTGGSGLRFDDLRVTGIIN